MKNYSRFVGMVLATVGLTAFLGYAAMWATAQQPAPGLSITFSNMTETLKVKEKTDKKTMITTITSNFTVNGDVVIDNTSTSKAAGFELGLWTGQTSSNIDEGDGDFPMFRKEKAPKPGKTSRLGIKLKFGTDQAGTYFFLTGLFTNTDYPVITFVQIPSAE